MKDKESLFDVVIYELESKKVDAIVGMDLRMDDGHYNARRRLDTAFSRINHRYSAAIIPAGSLKKGDVVKDAIE